MKKLFLIAAALTALVSCTKTEVIPEETAQQEIAMKAFNQTAVKTTGPIAPNDGKLTVTDESMTVYGYYANDGTAYSSTPYLDGVTFKYSTSDEFWKGWDVSAYKPYYWPSTGKMRFVAIFPSGFGVVNSNLAIVNTTPATTFVTTRIENIDLSTIQKDLMYSSVISPCPPATSPSLAFKHLFAQVVLNVVPSTNSAITIHSAKLVGANLIGEIIIEDDGESALFEYSNTTPDDGEYVVSSTSTEIAKATSTPTPSPLGTPALVFPTDAPKLTVVYSIGGSSTRIEKTIDLTAWTAGGLKYIYNLSFSLQEITFTATVNTWVDTPTTNGTDVTI